MSEEFIQKGYSTNGHQVEEYEFFNIGNTTINELKTYKVVKDLDYKEYGVTRPDGLLVDRRNKRKINVIAVVEFKDLEEFNTQVKKEIACKQCNTYAQVLAAKIGIITDGREFIWINPQISYDDAEVKYNDKNVFNDNKHNRNRGFDYIKREDGYQLSLPFIIDETKRDETK